MSDLFRAYHKRYYSELLPGLPDWIHEQLTEEALQAAARLNDEIGTSSELGDELLAERATFAEFKKHAWEQQRVLRAEVEKLKAELSGIRTAVIEACRNAQMKVLVWYPENTRNYIHPNQLTEIYKSQVTECLAAIERVFGENGRQQEDST